MPITPRSRTHEITAARGRMYNKPASNIKQQLKIYALLNIQHVYILRNINGLQKFTRLQKYYEYLREQLQILTDLNV